MITSIVIGIVLVLAFSFGVGSGADQFFDSYAKEISKAVKHKVHDKEHKEKALASVEKARKEVMATVKDAQPAQIKLREVDLSYDATLDEYLAADKPLDEMYEKQLDIVATSHFELKDILSEEEWNAVAKVSSADAAKGAKKQLHELQKAQEKRTKEWEKRLKD